MRKKLKNYSKAWALSWPKCIYSIKIGKTNNKNRKNQNTIFEFSVSQLPVTQIVQVGPKVFKIFYICFDIFISFVNFYRCAIKRIATLTRTPKIRPKLPRPHFCKMFYYSCKFPSTYRKTFRHKPPKTFKPYSTILQSFLILFIYIHFIHFH